MKITLQDATVVINNTSRYNNKQYDTVRVETLLTTTEALPNEMTWYVPSGTSIPPEVASLFKAKNIRMFPQREETLLKGTEDIIEQSKAENVLGVLEDASNLLLRAVLKETPLTPITGSPNTYTLSYEYKLFPIDTENNTFEFFIILPFDGLAVAQGGRVQMTILTPIGAKIDPNETKGIADTGEEISEMVADITHTNRQVVSFGWQNDPAFTVRYSY